MPSLTELSESIRFVVPSKDRDFSRQKEPFQAQSIPADVAMANDSGNAGIKAIQKVMRHNPIGPSYVKSFPIDGKPNRKILDVLLNFSWTVKRKTGKTFNIVKGNSINQTEFQKAWEAIKPKKKIETVETVELEGSELIRSFQNFFAGSQPLIGILYKGPKDGLINDDLIAAAKSTEAKIANAISNKGVTGMIWSGSAFKTSAGDVLSALELISNHQKMTVMSSKDRSFVFSKLLTICN